MMLILGNPRKEQRFKEIVTTLLEKEYRKCKEQELVTCSLDLKIILGIDAQQAYDLFCEFFEGKGVLDRKGDLADSEGNITPIAYFYIDEDERGIPV